jgi:hypothetical protein
MQQVGHIPLYDTLLEWKSHDVLALTNYNLKHKPYKFASFGAAFKKLIDLLLPCMYNLYLIDQAIFPERSSLGGLKTWH